MLTYIELSFAAIPVSMLSCPSLQGSMHCQAELPGCTLAPLHKLLC